MSYLYYQVDGYTAEARRAAMLRHGPSDGRTVWIGLTSWDIRWWYGYSLGAEGCRITSPQVEVGITIMLPRWVPPADTPQELVTRWADFVEALQHHEEGHVQIALLGGYEILEALHLLPASVSCVELDQAAQASAVAVTRRLNQHQRDYDAATGHGAHQGAVLP